MASNSHKVRILVVRSWTESLTPFRTALRHAKIDARIIRVDIEPALNAALIRGDLDVVVLDPNLTTITRDLVESRLREHGRATPIVMLEEPKATIATLARILMARLN